MPIIIDTETIYFLEVTYFRIIRKAKDTNNYCRTDTITENILMSKRQKSLGLDKEIIHICMSKLSYVEHVHFKKYSRREMQEAIWMVSNC